MTDDIFYVKKLSVLTKKEVKMEKKNENTENKIKQVVGFKIGNEEYVIDILKVQEIIKPVDITPIPDSPDFIEGVINLRGMVIPIVSLRKRFNFEELKDNKDTKIIVTKIDNHFIGFLVDSVTEVLRIPTKLIEPTPPLVSKIGSEFLAGVGKLEDRLVIFIDIDKILSAEEKEVIEKAL